MPVDYGEVLKDIDERESLLTAEIAKLRAARPLMLEFKKQQDIAAIQFAPPKKFVGVGPTRAIPKVLEANGGLMTVAEILAELYKEGWTTGSTNPTNLVSSTCAQLKDSVERVGDRWRLKPVNVIPDEVVTVSPGAADSMSNTILQVRPLTNESLPRLGQ
jgi:hypothetical protein